MNKLLIPLFAVLILGISTGYAQQYQELVEFPIPDNVEETFKKCATEKVDAIEFIFSCSWKFTAEQADKWYDDIIEKSKDFSLPEETCPDKFEMIDSQCVPILDVDPQDVYTSEQVNASPFTPREDKLFQYYADDIRRCETNPLDTIDAIALCEELTALKLCKELGTGAASGVQTRDTSVISENKFIESDKTPYKYKGKYGDLKREKIACDAAKLMKIVQFGVQYENRAGWFDFVELPHNERAIVDKFAWPMVPTHKDFALNYRTLFEENKKAFEIMCYSVVVTDEFKDAWGCEPKTFTFEELYPNGVFPEYQPMPDYTTDPRIEAYNCWKLDPDCALPAIFEKIENEKIDKDKIGGKQ